MTNDMIFTKEDLHVPINTKIKESRNTQTFFEFIRESEDQFGMDEAKLDGLSDRALNSYIEFLDYLWTK